MKFTLSWLRAISTPTRRWRRSPRRHRSRARGRGGRGPYGSARPFVIGRVVGAEPRPDADRLHVCRVETDEGEKQIGSGAPKRARGSSWWSPSPGLRSRHRHHVGLGTIRGVESAGMIASERELGLGEAHDGMIELPSGEVGQSFVDWPPRRPGQGRPGDRDRGDAEPARPASRARDRARPRRPRPRHAAPARAGGGEGDVRLPGDVRMKPTRRTDAPLSSASG